MLIYATHGFSFTDKEQYITFTKYKEYMIHKATAWVPENVLDPVCFRSNDRMDSLFVNFAKDYSGRISELEEKCKIIGGEYEKETGDTAWIFYPFPEIP